MAIPPSVLFTLQSKVDGTRASATRHYVCHPEASLKILAISI